MDRERQARQQAAYHFELQAHRLYLSVHKRLPNYRYILVDETSGRELLALVLTHTFDFYEYRLHRSKQHLDLLIVQQHDAAAPLKVIALDSSEEFEPGIVPAVSRPNAKRPSHRETLLLVSKLLLGLDSAKEELARMHPRTRQRYLQRCKQYLRPRRGRPQAS